MVCMMDGTRVITVATGKGGNGKSTMAVNIAATLAQNGHATLLVDFDWSGDASRLLGIEHGPAADDGKTFDQLWLPYLNGRKKRGGGASVPDIADIVMPSGHHSRLALLVGGPDLMDLEDAVGKEVRNERFDVLRRAIDNASLEFDRVVVDTRPDQQEAAIMGLYAADVIVTPLRMDDVNGVNGVLTFLELYDPLVAESATFRGRLAGALRTDYNPRLKEHKAADVELRDLGIPIIGSAVRRTTEVGKASREQIPFVYRQPGSLEASQMRAAVDEIEAFGDQLDRERERAGEKVA